MIEADPLTMVTFAHDGAQMVAQAGPPVDMPAQVPDFVSGLLDTIANAAGEGGLGDRISELTPGGGEMADGAADGVGNPAK